MCRRSISVEGSATAEKSVRDFEFIERFQDFSKDFRFQPIQQKISRFQQRFQDFSEDFRFREDFCRDFKISLVRFQDFSRDFMVVRGQGTLRGAGASATECYTASAKVCMREVKGIC